MQTGIKNLPKESRILELVDEINKKIDKVVKDPKKCHFGENKTNISVAFELKKEVSKKEAEVLKACYVHAGYKEVMVVPSEKGVAVPKIFFGLVVPTTLH